MSPHESDNSGRLPEVGSQQTTAEINELLDSGYENITRDGLWNLATTTIKRCDELANEVKFSTGLTYEKILGPLCEIDDMVIQVSGLLSLVSMLHPNQDVRKIATKTIDAFIHDATSYSYNFDIRKKVNSFSWTKEADGLEGEEKLYLRTVVNWFEMAGGNLSRSQRKKVRNLNTSLLELENQFESNIAEDNTIVIFNHQEIDGLDEQARNEYLVDLGNGQYELSMIDSSYNGFLTLASNRDARRVAYEAYNARVKNDNQEILQKIIHTRQRLAKALRYESWLDLCNKYNMVDSPDSIADMYASVIGPVTAQAKRELAVMEKMLEADGHSGPLQEYDWKYYEEKLFQDKYGTGLDKVREYFPLSAVLEETFERSGELFKLQYRPVETKTWHPDVFAFEVCDLSGIPLGKIFFDLFPRNGKYKHCCTLPFVSGRTMADGSYRQPSIVIIANLPNPAGGHPSLLSQTQRVDTFHESGHAQHQLVGKARLSAFDSLATEIDFVEIPSQLMENLAWDRDSIRRYSSHYETGEPMPEEMVDLLIDSQKINIGIRYLRSVSLALFDLSLHNTLEPIDLNEKWSQAVAVSAFPEVPGTFFPATFDHLASDYGGAYYSYFYDEFFVEDIFQRFEQEGLTSSDVGMDYRKKMLEPGASKFGMEMIRDFLGRSPDKEVLLRKLGKVMVAET